LFCGAESSQPNIRRKLLAAGFENPCVLMKKGKASMDDKLFATILEWFAGELTRKCYTGKHVLLIDCHDSHERARPLQMAMAKNVVLLTFPSHCTHLLQPLDISFFKALNVKNRLKKNMQQMD
jgi:hypothetical protein